MPVSLGREIAKLALPAAAVAALRNVFEYRVFSRGRGFAAATTFANNLQAMILSFGAIRSAVRHHRAVGRAVA